MLRHIFWQAVLAAAGIALVFLVLFQLAAGQTTVELPVAGGAYVEGVVGAVSIINPILAPRIASGNPVDQDLGALVFEGLTALDPRGEITPALATDWTVDEAGVIYEFRLRRGVTWHDGAPFDAADVLFTVQAIQDPDFQGDPGLAQVWRNAQVEMLDNYTVRMVLSEPFPSFLYYTTIGLLPAHLLGNVPAAQLAEDDFSTQKPVGTGRFLVESVSPDRVILSAYDGYWGAKPFLERIEFWCFGDADGLLAAYGRGEVTGFALPDLRYLSSLKSMRRLELYSAEAAGYGAVLLNLRSESRPFLSEVEVRQALLYALDRQRLIDEVLEGQGLVADSPIAPMLWAHEPAVRQYGFDVERARGLLDAGGWMDSDGDRVREREGVTMTLELLTSDELVRVALAGEIVRQWQEIGVSATIRVVAAGEVPSVLRSREFDAVLTNVTLIGDPDPYPLWHSTQAMDGGQNVTGYASEQADLAMERARAAFDPGERGAAYREFQRIFAEDVPALLLYYPVYTYAVDSRARQVQIAPLLHASDRFRNVAEWYVETARVVVTEGETLDSLEK